MSKISFDPDPEHALSFDRDEHYVIGHLLSMKLGTSSTLTADINVLEPMFQTKKTVVGLVNKLEWAGGPEDSIDLEAMISTPNRQQIMTLVHSNVASMDATFQVEIYEYDDAKLKWFRALYTMSELSAKVAAAGGYGARAGLELSMDETPLVLTTTGGGAASPNLWNMKITVEATATVQTIHYLTGYSSKIAKKWGVPRT